jgi:hypothetical protein
MVKVALRCILGVTRTPVQRIFAGSDSKASATAVKDGRPNRERSKIDTGHDAHKFSPWRMLRLPLELVEQSIILCLFLGRFVIYGVSLFKSVAVMCLPILKAYCFQMKLSRSIRH